MSRERLAPLAMLEPEALSSVTGGRIVSPNSKPDPVTLQMIQKLLESISTIGQNLAQSKQAGQQQMMQMMQGMMGGGDKGGSKH